MLSRQFSGNRLLAGWLLVFPCLWLCNCQPGHKALLDEFQQATLAAQVVADSVDICVGQTDLLLRLVNDAPSALMGKPALTEIVQRINTYSQQRGADQDSISVYLVGYQSLQADLVAKKKDPAAVQVSLGQLKKKISTVSGAEEKWRGELNQLRTDYSLAVHQVLDKK